VTSPDMPSGGDFGRVEVDVVPNARGFAAAVKRDLDAQTQTTGEDLGRRIAAPIGKQVSASVISGLKGARKDIPRQADAMGRDFGDRFGATLQDGITKALKGLPKVKLTADSTDLDKQAAHIRKELEALGDKRIGIDIGADEAIAKVQLLRGQASALARQIEKLKAAHPDITIDTNAVATMAELTAVHTQLKALSREHASVGIDVDEGAFAAKLRAAVAAANEALPDIRPGVDASPAEEKIAEIKASLLTLRDAHIGVDLDAGAAMAKVAVLISELEVLKRTGHVNLDFDVGAAQAKLAGVGAELAGVAGESVMAAGAMKLLDFAASGVAIKFGAIVAVGGLIIAVLVPALAAIVPILGAIGVGVAAAVGAFGVLIAGLVPIIAAYQALGKAQTQHGRVAQRSTRDVQAAADAERNAAQARVAAARQIQQADDQIVSAERGVKDAYAAVKQASADVLSAQKAVNDARAQARRDEEDLASQIAHNAQDQRQNALDLAEAKKRLDQVMANPAASKAERDQAQLSYDRLTTQNQDLKTQQQRLAEEKKKHDRQGIEGSDRVVAAKQAEARAEKELADRKQAYADAQKGLSRAEADAAYTRVQAANSVADAQRAVTRAQQQQTTALAGTGTAADDAAKKLAKLSPAAASLVKYLKGLDFGPLLRASQGFAGPLETGLKGFLSTMMPILVTFATQVSAAIGSSMQILLTAFSSPYWQQFLVWLGQVTAQALPGFAQGFELVARMVTGLIQAFGPLSGKIGAGVLRMLAQAADWATSLGKNKGFQTFLDYAMRMLPKVGALLASMWGAVKNVVIALAPIGEWALGFFTGLFDYIAGIDTGTLTTILKFIIGGAAAIAGIGAVAKIVGPLLSVGRAIGTVAGWLMRIPAIATAVEAALAVMTGPIGWIIAAVVAVGIALFVLYKKNKAFHDLVNRIWKAIAGFFVTAWKQYIWPALQAIWDFITGTLAPIFVWLWQGVIAPAFAGIWAVIQTAWAVIQVVFQAIWTFISTVLAPIFVWLWQTVIAPAFAGIWAVIQVAWTVIQVVFQAIWTFISTVLAPVFLWLWQHVILPAWQGIQLAISIAWGVIRIIFGVIQIGVYILARIFSWLWKNVISPVFTAIWTLIKWVWEVILWPVFKAIWGFISNTLGPIFKWLYENVIKPAWDGIWKTINTVWGWIKGVFDKLGNYITTTVKPAFEKGVGLIGKAWEALKDAMKLPVTFVVQTVINKGIIGTLNKVGEFLKIPGFHIGEVPLPAGWTSPAGHATGGPVRGPGTTTSDSILARLSDDEHVWTAAEVAAVGGHDNMLKLRRAALAGRLSELAGFAGGGPVSAGPAVGADGLPAFKDGGGVFGWIGDKVKGVAGVVSDFAKAAWDAVRDPKQFLKDLSAKLIAQVPFKDAEWFKLLTGIPQRVTDKAVDWLKGLIGKYKETAPDGAKPWSGTLSPDPLLKNMQEWALGQRGKTYLWTAVGPERYDCSGLVGNLWAMATGNSLYSRYMTTAGMGAGKYGMEKGPGRLTVYLKRGSHTAANIDGLHAEAYHGNGTPLAIGHVGTRLSYYDEVLHLPGLARGGRVAPSILNATADDRLRAFLQCGWPEPPLSYDSGGLLHDTRALPGGVMPVYHGSSTPDAVLTDRQWKDMHALASGGSGGRGGLNIEHYHERGSDPATVARDLDWLARGLG
jgi:hypothetical protein